MGVQSGPIIRPAQSQTIKMLARPQALKARICTILRRFGSDFGRGADFQAPDAIPRIAPEPIPTD